MERRAGRAGVEGAWRAWEAVGDPRAPALAAVAAVSREEERGRLEKGEGEWRLKQLEGWDCKIAKGKEGAPLFIEKMLGLGFS